MKKIKTKITVIKRMINKDLIEDYIQNTSNFSICDKVTDGQEFIVSGKGTLRGRPNQQLLELLRKQGVNATNFLGSSE